VNLTRKIQTGKKRMEIASANEGVTKILITTWTNSFFWGTATEKIAR
jgi:hypothetical protein